MQGYLFVHSKYVVCFFSLFFGEKNVFCHFFASLSKKNNLHVQRRYIFTCPFLVFVHWFLHYHLLLTIITFHPSTSLIDYSLFLQFWVIYDVHYLSYLILWTKKQTSILQAFVHVDHYSNPISNIQSINLNHVTPSLAFVIYAYSSNAEILNPNMKLGSNLLMKLLGMGHIFFKCTWGKSKSKVLHAIFTTKIHPH
jgi:hypothetical protein